MISSYVKKSIAESIASLIRTDILTGNMKPGDKLKEQELCSILNVSRTPLREAFRILQSQNLITYSPYVGVFVSNLTEKYILDMWEIKFIIEPESSFLAAANRTDKNLEELKEILDDAEANCLTVLDKYVLVDNRFHSCVAKSSGNEELRKMIDNIYECTSLPRSRTFTGNRPPKISHEEHLLIYNALQRGEAESAKALTHRHLESGRQAVLASIKFRG